MFKDQRIVLTGGSSGLGLALARALAAQGAKLALIARTPDKLDAAVASIRRDCPATQIEGFALDVTQAEKLPTVLGQIDQRFGGIDMLINNAGILREGYFEKLSEDDFRQIMEINFHSVVNLTRAALPYLKASQGRLVNIASVAGLTGSFGYSAYSAAKHALVGFTDCLYYELRPQGVQVHLVCPAEFDSPMIDELDTYRTPENLAHTLTIPKVPVDVIVDGTLKGIRNNRYRIVPGRMAQLAVEGLRLFPAGSRKIGERTVAKVYVGPGE